MKFDEIRKMIEEDKPAFGLISGDIFHIKNSDTYSPKDINYYCSLFESLGLQWYSIPGNHDLPKSALKNRDKSAYRTFTKACSCVEDISEVNLSFSKESTGSIPITITGVPYYPLEPLRQKVLPLVNENMTEFQDTLVIAMVHIDALPNNDIPLFWETISYDGLLDLIPNVNIVCMGHIHQQFPVFKREIHYGGKPRIQMISKPWSFARVVKDYFNQTEIMEHQHKPSMGVISVDGGKVTIEYKVIPHKPFAESFLQEDFRRQAAKSDRVAGFMEKVKELYSEDQNIFEIVSPEEFFQTKSVPEEVLNLINEYLENV
jgi:hypothetical protein